MHVCGHMKPSDIYEMIQNIFPCKQQNHKNICGSNMGSVSPTHKSWHTRICLNIY